MFKVGDRVTGLPGAPYSITNEDSVCEIVYRDAFGYMSVKVIYTVNIDFQAYVGEVYPVKSEHFRLVNNGDRFEFHKKRVEERHLKGFAN